MPHFVLYMKIAESENIDSVQLVDDAHLCVSVRNPQSDYEMREKVVFRPMAVLEQADEDRTSPCHFQLKWDGAKKASTLTCLNAAEAKTAFKKSKQKDGILPRSYVGASDNDVWVPLLVVSCRGLEPFAFHPMGQEFKVVSSGGTEFGSGNDDEGVDLADGDWAEYDEANDQSVGLTGVEFKWEAV
ncbi:hypothetical protein MPSEU_000339800 [Mayamaea pseudoterrestris]|nr:hypothetical protein MPSEU_000339800 [Mayamaea pseudoterrestris]